MSITTCTNSLNASGSILSTVCSSDNQYAVYGYTGSTEFVTVAIIRPDGTIGLNKDLHVHTDFLMYVIVFPLIGLYVFWRLFKFVVTGRF